jgi:hypothetical protein
MEYAGVAQIGPHACQQAALQANTEGPGLQTTQFQASTEGVHALHILFVLLILTRIQSGLQTMHSGQQAASQAIIEGVCALHTSSHHTY